LSRLSKRKSAKRKVAKKNNQTKLLSEEEALAKELRQLGLSDRIVSVLLGEKDKPEGPVRAAWIKRLIVEYGFPASNLDINVAAGVGRDAGKENIPVRADIVVYRDESKTMPFVVVETKAPDEKRGVPQAESYARNLGSEYHVWSNASNTRFFKTSHYPNLSEPISYLPVWVSNKPQVKRVPKTKELRPFKDEKELKQVISSCHDFILEKLGHDPAKAFDEMAKLLFLKLYDEREVPNYYDFVVLADEEPHDVADRIRKTFDKAISSSKYQDVFWSQFNTIPVPVTLELDDFTIFHIVQILQGYSLVNTTENIQGADIKGVVYEQMVGTTFRGELAQFFTPRELVDFIVEVVRPNRETKVADIACGSGGFLIMVLRKLREWIKEENPNLSDADIRAEIKYFAEHKMFGVDISDRMVRVAKMNSIMHGDGHSGIFHILRGGGLLTDPNLPERLKEELKEGTVDVIFSNPPFAGREKDPKILEKFDLGKNEEGDPRTVSKEVLFIEKIIRLLKVGGKAGLVLPAGIFNNPSMERVRDYIKEHVKILALVGLPHLTFQVTGANNEGHLLFIEKVKEIQYNYPIFIDWAVHVGIDAVGRKTGHDDLPSIAERFRSPSQGNIIMFRDLKERIDPWYYHPNYAKLVTTLKQACPSWEQLEVVFTESTDLFDRTKCGDETLRYIEKADVDVETGRVVSFSEHTPNTIPNRATYVLRANDILFPNSYDSLRGVAIVPKEYDGYIGSNRFFVLRHRPERIRLEYVRYHFTKPEILALIKRECSGEINPGIAWPAFSNISIPLPSLDGQDRVLEEINGNVKSSSDASDSCRCKNSSDSASSLRVNYTSLYSRNGNNDRFTDSETCIGNPLSSSGWNLRGLCSRKPFSYSKLYRTIRPDYGCPEHSNNELDRWQTDACCKFKHTKRADYCPRLYQRNDLHQFQQSFVLHRYGNTNEQHLFAVSCCEVRQRNAFSPRVWCKSRALSSESSLLAENRTINCALYSDPWRKESFRRNLLRRYRDYLSFSISSLLMLDLRVGVSCVELERAHGPVESTRKLASTLGALHCSAIHVFGNFDANGCWFSLGA
jgi:type I restriction enzyme M protein